MIKLITRTLTAALALWMASCTSPRERRLEENAATLAALPPIEQQLIRQGRISRGMNSQAVFLALGPPNRVSSGAHQNVVAETWIYRGVRAVPNFNNWHHPYYYGRGHHHCDPFPTYNYISYERAIVTFINDLVVAFELTM